MLKLLLHCAVLIISLKTLLIYWPVSLLIPHPWCLCQYLCCWEESGKLIWNLVEIRTETEKFQRRSMVKIFIISVTVPRRMETFNSFETVALYRRRGFAMSLMFDLITIRKSVLFSSFDFFYVREYTRLSCALGAFCPARRKLDMLKLGTIQYLLLSASGSTM